MKLELMREGWTDTATHGKLYIDGVYFCDTLEDRDRFLEKHGAEAKVDGQTCIPRGSYRLEVTFSNRFKNYMPELLEVPCFKGIRIHAGNTHEDTEGCILVGEFYKIGQISSSRVTYQRLLREMEGQKDIEIVIM
jgi:hypothetical protein